jgi:hypothetical protein
MYGSERNAFTQVVDEVKEVTNLPVLRGSFTSSR